MFTIAHVTDTHFGNRPGVRARNEAIVEALCTLRPDVVVVTGDVADHGTSQEYAQAREVFAAWDGPLLWLPGNHDVREHFVRDLLGGDPPPQDRPVLSAHDVGPARFLLLDSLVSAVDGDRVDHGELTDEAHSWLEAQLGDPTYADRPTFVCLHHPPTRLGIAFMDDIRLREPGPLARLIAGHAQVAAVLVGHAHAMATTTFAGRPLLVGGAVSSTIPLAEEGYAKKIVNDLPPAYALHVLLDEIDEYAQPDEPAQPGEPAQPDTPRRPRGYRLVTHWRAVANA